MNNSIPVNMASQQTADWRAYNLAVAPNNIVNGFFIPINSVNGAMLNAQNGLRVYGALAQTGDPSSLHLVIVGVDINGNDVLTNPDGSSAIFDFTAPCPLCCGGGNSLNGGLLNS